MRLLYIIVCCLSASSVLSHICLITPRQRGLMDISEAGSHTCTRHEEPCGGQDIESPSVEYKTGETVFIKWQQNLNHYEPGYPGYMDISIANSAYSTDFTTLAVVTDKYVHAQDYQENYTAIVKLPDMPCDHCVIRARYNAHKPGETTFLQCADIKITSSSGHATDNALKFTPSKELSLSDKQKMLPLKRALRLRKKHLKMHSSKNGIKNLYGFAYNPFEPQRSHYVSIDTNTGKTQTINSFNFGIDTPTLLGGEQTFLLDEIVSIDYLLNTSNVLLHKKGGRDDAASTLYVLGTTNGSLVQYSEIFEFKGGAINALSWFSAGTSAVFRIQPAGSAGWIFEVGTMDLGGIYTKCAQIPKPENLYVNFQWLETDCNNNQKVFALMGNENAPEELNARIYSFDVSDGQFIQYTELDVSTYTFMSMHSYQGSDSLFAFSPGLWSDTPHGWYLVAIDPMQGTVTKKCDIAPPGIFQRHYGGSVSQGYSNKHGFLYHVLRVEGSDADFLVAVNPETCEVNFSEATNLRHIHSLQRPAA